MPGGLRHIKPLLISSLDTALNQYLALDEHIDQLLAPLAGKVIAIHITPYDETLYLCPTRHNIQMLESWHGEVDARLTGSLSALGLMGLSATPMHAFFKGDVKIEGDTETAHKLQKLFAKLDLNLENRLAQITGVGFAHNLGQVFQQGRQWLRNSSHSLRLNIEEYLQEETRDLPAKPEAELLFGAIDLCRSDYDRLKARVERLETTLAEPQPQTGTPL